MSKNFYSQFKMAILNIDNLPFELFLDIFSFLDLDAFCNARLVSKKWKRLVVDALPEFHFVVPVNDTTVSAISNLTETAISLCVQNFTGKANESQTVSATTGIGLLFGQAETITFNGDKIAPAEIQKLLPFATDTVRKLSFVNLGHDVSLRPLLDMKATFSALRELEINTRELDISFGFQLSGFATMFECYTSIIQRLAALDSGPQMPLLESLKLSFNPKSFGYLHRFTEDMFANFLAIAKLILKFRRTLKEVEIDFTGTSDAKRNPTRVLIKLSQAEQTEMQECVDAFHELVNLNRIRCRAVNVRDNPWDWELQLLRRPTNLKELELVSPRFDGLEYYDFPEMVRLLFPKNRQMLTSIKIGSHRPDEHPDLGLLGQSPNLKILWLEFYVYESPPMPIKPMCFINVDKLHKQITSLHLKSDRMYDRRRQYVILSREQIRWIVDHLQDLKSFWAQLVLQTAHNDNPNAAGNTNDNDAHQARPKAEEYVSSPSNIDVELFRDIMNMPKIRDLKFDMLRTRNMSDVIPIEEIQKYSGMYKCVPNITTTCQTFPFVSYEQPFACTELTIRIDQLLTSK